MMAYKFLCFVVVVLAVSTNSAFEIVDYTFDDINDYNVTVRECTRPGYMCDGCSISNFCYQQPNGTWVKEYVENCTQTQQTCRDSTGTCTNGVNEPCTSATPEINFLCTQVGTFPDPYDCTKYHMCVPAGGNTTNLVRYSLACPTGVWFDALTLSCSVDAVGQCVQPVPTCTQATQGPVLGNSRMYYACLPTTGAGGERIFAPAIFLCPGSFRYMRGECADPKLPLGVVNGTCTLTGNLYAPACNTYSVCSAVGVAPVLTSCGAASFFNATAERCEGFSCSSLRPQ